MARYMQRQAPKARVLLRQMQAAPTANRRFHVSDLCHLIGHAAYEAWGLDVIRKFGFKGFRRPKAFLLKPESGFEQKRGATSKRSGRFDFM
ncbi:hypothetical protein [Celeribacter sp. ULVN23_4]